MEPRLIYIEQAAHMVPPRAVKKLRGFRELIERLNSHLFASRSSRDRKLSDLTLAMLSETGYDKWIREENPQGEERWGNVRELINFASSFTDMETWLDDIALMSNPQALVSGEEEVGSSGRGANSGVGPSL